MSEWVSHLQKAPDNGKTSELSWNQHLLAFGLRVWANLFRDLDWACGLSFVHESGRRGACCERSAPRRRPSLTSSTLSCPSPATFPHNLLIKPLCSFSCFQMQEDRSDTILRRRLLRHDKRESGSQPTFRRCPWVYPCSCRAVSLSATERGSPINTPD